MNEKNYFKNLVKLYEAHKELEIKKSSQTLKEDSQEQPLPEATPAVAEKPTQAEELPDVPKELSQEIDEDPAMDDADYLSMDPLIAGSEIPVTSPEKEKLTKLFDLYKDLIDYASVFYESLNVIDTNLLDKENNDGLVNKRSKINVIIKKLDDYLLRQISTKKYEESLYIYILLRTELVSIVKSLRRTLKLDEKDDMKDENSKF